MATAKILLLVYARKPHVGTFSVKRFLQLC